MIHFGLYSLLGGEFFGKRTKGVPEWILHNKSIPLKEYTKLADAFNPVYFNAEEWISLAKDAGMKYIVVTSKHHEGFALFDSEYDDYNCVKGSPFKRDIIKELSDACKKYDMKFGVYYSHELDWHEKNGGGYTSTKGEVKENERYWSNDWDYPDWKEKDFDKYFKTKVLTQVRELLTNYGDIFEIWFDMPCVITKEQSQFLYDYVKSLQPNCLINSRIGNDLGDFKSMGDNELPDKDSGILVESPCTLNNSWGFKYYDDNWKTPEKVLEMKEHCKEKGANFLINIGPDGLGRFPAPAIDILKAIAEKNK